MAVNPAKFVREVRTEASRVTWPGRRETLVTTGIVLVITILSALFFLVVDQVVAMGVQALFKMHF